jgi:hypothetical protein
MLVFISRGKQIASRGQSHRILTTRELQFALETTISLGVANKLGISEVESDT